VFLSNRAHGQMDVFRQTADDMSEAGGILLGRVFLASGDIVIDHATTPTLEDERSRFRFFRAREPAQRIVDEAWAGSGGYSIYLGEWHTHPEDVPSPSWCDRRNWKRVARTATYEQDVLLFLIVGRARLGVWATDRRANIVPLMPVRSLLR
jgi:integrative and conjugative element protein (TIGR02256 family)